MKDLEMRLFAFLLRIKIYVRIDTTVISLQ